MFEITADDIARLGDADLRTLVALLCEAELRVRELPTSCVTWGGHQNASDGGIDVRVALPPATPIEGFVPRPATGFQVKKGDLPPGKILEEMRPDGLRQSIRDLADQGGAYIIVSADGSTADSALNDRRDAMAEAIADLATPTSLHLDFYDRSRLATWVRNHAGLVIWVRERTGRPLVGWQPFGAWAYPQGGADADYLIDEDVRVKTAKHGEEAGLGAVPGIERIRDCLREVRGVVRLVGLSGLGKTRLVQALFDERVGIRGLDPALAVYTNIADGPVPQPIGLASDLVALQERGILVIDNCPPELHRRLAELVGSSQSRVSVITVEYDVRDDQPEDTAVFSLEPSSDKLIERLVHVRFPVLSQVDLGTIARLSGGNARIALALARTVEGSETLSGLPDEVVFQRLFLQRHEANPSLYRAAQACSVVYSFEGENTSEDSEAELYLLSALVSQRADELYSHTAELHRRDLMQRRGVWRAVLPHAIANRLAKTALQNIPPATIERFWRSAPVRLLRSFSRRLGYLDDSAEARHIIAEWLGAGGLLENPAELNENGRAIFENVAPVAPEATLAALERTFGDADKARLENGKHYVQLIRSLAYDSGLFVSSATLLARFATAEEITDRPQESVQTFVSLFTLYLSGTHATIEQRLQVIAPLLRSQDANENRLGIKALSAAMEVSHFSSIYRFEFGSRSRDHGSWPRTRADVHRWFGAVLALVREVGCSDSPCAADVRTTLAHNFSWLWNITEMHDALDDVCRKIAERQFWPKGWLAVRQKLEHARKDPAAPDVTQLGMLEAILRPANMAQRIRSVVLSTRSAGVDFEDIDDDSPDDMATRMARTNALVLDLGRAAAGDDAVLSGLLPDLVSSDGELWGFGRGLCSGASNATELWNRLVVALSQVPSTQQRAQVLGGFLYELNIRDAALTNTLLDEAVAHETLGPWYPWLQTVVGLDERAVARLLRALTLDKAKIHAYGSLAGGRATEPLSGDQVRSLVLAIAAKPDGFEVAAEVLSARLWGDKDRNETVLPEIIDAGCLLIEGLTFEQINRRDEHDIKSIIKACAVGERGAALVRDTCERFERAVIDRDTYAFKHDVLLAALFNAQPLPALRGICDGGQAELERGTRIISDVSSRAAPMDSVPDEDLLAWCDEEPAARYPAMASVITIAAPRKEAETPQWSRIALGLLERAPDKKEVLRQLILQFSPSGVWSGSLATILETNAKLLDSLPANDAVLRDFIAEERTRVAQMIEAERTRETSDDRFMDERFE